MPSQTDTDIAPPMSRRAVAVFVAYFAVMLPALLFTLHALISRNTFPARPVIPAGTAAAVADSLRLVAASSSRLIFTHGEMLLAVIVMGALGSYIHAVTSFASYAGNRRLGESWGAWYALRPFVGVAMALTFYVAARGSVLVLSAGNGTVDPYAMMTVAALAGMFSKQASDKLADVFDTLFKSRADAERRDKLDNPLPRLSAAQPDSAAEGSAGVAVTLTGADFVDATQARFDGQRRETRVRSTNQLVVMLLAEDLATSGTHEITAVNPAPGGGISSPVPFTVTPRLAGTEPAPREGVGDSEKIPDAVFFGVRGQERDGDDDVAAADEGEG